MASPFGSFQVRATMPPLSATALLQKAATMGAVAHADSTMAHLDMSHVASAWQKSSDGLTRDFLGLTGDVGSGCGSGNGVGDVREVLPFPGAVKFSAAYDRDHSSMMKHHGFGFTETCSGWGNC